MQETHFKLDNIIENRYADVSAHSHPLDVSKMLEEELSAELDKGYQDMLEGRVKPAREMFAELNIELCI